MLPSYPRIGRWLDRGESWLESLAARTALSILILLSVLPPSVLSSLLPLLARERHTPFFLVVFVPEFLLRLVLFERRRRQQRLQRGEILLLALDFLAVLSFLPLVADAGYLRFFRLARLVLLAGYWRGVAQELGALLTRRDRRFQILLVFILAALLALASTVVLIDLREEHDFNGDGKIDGRDGDFLHVLWWSFRQVQDPGNLVGELTSGPLVVISLALTFAGLLLLSFFIGIGTTLVGELIERSRSQRVDLHNHTVILGLTPYSSILLRGLAEIYRKNLRPFKAAVLADAAMPDVLSQPVFRGFEYRRGLPARTSDLDRVDVGHAKRVIVLGDDSADPDATVISAILATRDRNPTVDLYPDLEHERNFPAARAAGGKATHLIGSGSLIGYYLAQNIAYPGVYQLYRQLLTSAGCEIYTYLLPEDRRQRFRRAGGGERLDPLALHHLARERGVTLLGLFVAEDAAASLEVEDLELVLHPIRQRDQPRRSAVFDASGRLRRSRIRGFIGLALRFSDLTDFVDALGSGAVAGTAPPLSHGAGALPSDLRLEPDRGDVRRVLILGLGLRAPRVIEELVQFFGRLEVTVLARDDDPFEATIHDVRTMLSEAFGGLPELEEDDGSGVVRLRLDRGASLQARITFMVADWTHHYLLEERAGVKLESADVILLLLGSDRTRDSDGSIALDCLHLANLERTGALCFRPGTHILALVRDPDKGRLLESRLARMGGRSGTARYTVIARESARHRFIMQCVFVHGLNAIYLDLMSSRGQTLSRLVPAAAPPGTFEPRQLGDSLLRERGLLLIGIERHRGSEAGGSEAGDSEAGGSEGEKILLEPRLSSHREPIPWPDVAALYVLGEGSDVAALQGNGKIS